MTVHMWMLLNHLIRKLKPNKVFLYIHPKGQVWNVPTGSCVNTWSLPSVFWNMVELRGEAWLEK